LINGFISFYFLEGFINGEYWIPSIAPLLCLFSNFYILTDKSFFFSNLIPSFVLALMFIFCCALFFNVVNQNIEFETPFMEKIALHTERTAAFTLAIYLIDLFSFNNFSIYSILLPILVILLTNL
jgi:hypothetical protein